MHMLVDKHQFVVSVLVFWTWWWKIYSKLQRLWCITWYIHRVVFSKVFVFTFFIRLANLFFRRSLRDVYGTSKTNNLLSFHQQQHWSTFGVDHICYTYNCCCCCFRWLYPIMSSDEDYNSGKCNANETRAASLCFTQIVSAVAYTSFFRLTIQDPAMPLKCWAID
jgi:hypothetical protein